MGFKSSKLVILDFCAQTIPRIPCRHDFLYKAPSKTKHFYSYLVPVSEFVVVIILSEWWLMPTTANHCGHIPAVGVSGTASTSGTACTGGAAGTSGTAGTTVTSCTACTSGTACWYYWH